MAPPAAPEGGVLSAAPRVAALGTEAGTGERFQILALSGGGFRGLYTAKILADFEQELGGSIGRHFDLIAGTSIGGILALAVSMEIPAQRIVDLFVKHGADIFKRRWSLGGYVRAPYSAKPLQRLLTEPELFGEKLLGFGKHPVIVPAINYSSGKPVIFKSPHHETFKRDHTYRLVDIALATSAAPAYFPRHCFGDNQYVDGGLFANAPGLLGLHEAQHFFGREAQDVWMLSIGSMSARFTVDPRRNREGGTWDWGGWNPANMPKRLFGLSISVQESLTDYIVKHRLGDHYHHLDDDLTDERAGAVALDKADRAAREVLLGSGAERSKIAIGDARVQRFLKHNPAMPVFHYGPNAASKE
jgi:predicted acylesterase/phospholipase RssA